MENLKTIAFCWYRYRGKFVLEMNIFAAIVDPRI